MTRKHYVMLAAALRPVIDHRPSDLDYAHGWHAAASGCAHAIARALAEDNPAFDAERFLQAAGIPAPFAKRYY